MTMKVLYGFRAALSDTLPMGAVALPLCADATAWVAAQLGSSDHAWVTIHDDLGAEVVRLSVFGGVLSISRGRDGTTARQFPAGVCVSGELTAAAVKDLLCHYDCCATPQCGEVFE